MAMAPRKKSDFFNGGRGVNLNDIYMEDTKPQQPPVEDIDIISPDPYIHERDWDQYPTTGGSFVCGRSSSSPPPLAPPHLGYPHPEYIPDYPETSLSGSQSPTGYTDHSQGGYHSPNGYPPHSPVGMSIIGTPGPHEGQLPQNSMPWSIPNEEEDSRKKKKRHQRCRLCANHGADVEVKGHKWYCPYRDAHNCDKCEITRKRQYYMAEQQKLTREQQQQMQAQHNKCNNNRGFCSSNVGGVANVVGSLHEVTSTSMGANVHPSATHHSEFPRLDELVRETANIINEDLFDMINQVVRPRAKQ